MKRDMDLARKIILEIEKSPSPNRSIKISFKNVSDDAISYHIKILHQAGLIEADDFTDSGKFCWSAKTLTWEGHEFLDVARDDTIWKKAKNTIIEKGGTFTFSILKQILSILVKESIFPSTG